MDKQTERSVLRAAWSQLKKVSDRIFKQTQTFKYGELTHIKQVKCP